MTVIYFLLYTFINSLLLCPYRKQDLVETLLKYIRIFKIIQLLSPRFMDSRVSISERVFSPQNPSWLWAYSAPRVMGTGRPCCGYNLIIYLFKLKAQLHVCRPYTFPPRVMPFIRRNSLSTLYLVFIKSVLNLCVQIYKLCCDAKHYRECIVENCLLCFSSYYAKIFCFLS
jgi:hypothetical protein